MASTDRQSTGRKPKAKSAGKIDQKAQSERFIETARKSGADEAEGEFERAAASIIRSSGRKFPS